MPLRSSSGIGNWAGSKSPTVRLQIFSPALLRARMSAAMARISEPTSSCAMPETRAARAPESADRSSRTGFMVAREDARKTARMRRTSTCHLTANVAVCVRVTRRATVSPSCRRSASALDRALEDADRAPRAQDERARLAGRRGRPGGRLERGAVEQDLAAARAALALDPQLARRSAGHEQGLGPFPLAREQLLQEGPALLRAHEEARSRLGPGQLGSRQGHLETRRGQPQDARRRVALQGLEAHQEVEVV